MNMPGQITEALESWKHDHTEGLRELMPLAYPQLRRIAASCLRREGRNHTLQPTGLVHELYIYLVRQRKTEFRNRTEFFAFSAHLMRLILRDWARERAANKRGANPVRIPLSEDLAWVDAAGPDLLDLDAALDELAQIDERKVRLLELKVFLGCSSQEAAELLNISRATVERDYQFLRAWLYRKLRGSVRQA